MIELLKELGFEEAIQNGSTGYFKIYSRCILFVTKKIVTNEYVALITCRNNIEISPVNDLWVRHFDYKNK